MGHVGAPSNDECYTPDYDVSTKSKHTEFHQICTVCCPFDKEDSEFVKLISKTNPVDYSEH